MRLWEIVESSPPARGAKVICRPLSVPTSLSYGTSPLPVFTGWAATSANRPALRLQSSRFENPPALGIECRELFVRQRDIDRRDVFLEMFDLRGAGNRQHHRATLQHPGESDLARRGIVPSGDRIEQRARLCQIAGGERIPGNEADIVLGAIVEHVLAGAIDKIVAVLDSGDLKVFRGRLNVGDGDFAQTRMADETSIEQRLDRIELLLGRNLRVDAVELPEVDLLEAEIAQALMRLLDQIFGPATGSQISGPWRVRPPLVAMMDPAP